MVTIYERLRAVANDGGAEVVAVRRVMTSVMLAVFVSTTFPCTPPTRRLSLQ
jgi:hypothetical protein